ncbi:hypothetical protein DL96DRAFT_1677696 [Flagelloscypha sp. PMI_526]|nr:hypothetical protein DL96DRAFT_1677696 [Flagelloscypha sp. PMI_526]
MKQRSSRQPVTQTRAASAHSKTPRTFFILFYLATMHRFTLLYAFVAFLSISGIIDALPTGKREPKVPLAGASHLSRTQPLPRLVALSRSARSLVPQSPDLLLSKRGTKPSKPGGSVGISVPGVPQTKPKKPKSGEDKKDDDAEKDDDDKKGGDDDDEKKDDEDKKDDDDKKGDDDKKDEEDKEDKPKEKKKKTRPLTKAEKKKLKEQEEAEAKKQAEEKKKQEDEENDRKQREKEEKRLKAEKAKDAAAQEERDRVFREQKAKAEALRKEAEEKRAAAQAKVKVPQGVQATCGGSRVHTTAKLVEGITDALLRLDTLKKNPVNQGDKEQPKSFGGVDQVSKTEGTIRKQFTKCDTSKQLLEWPIFTGKTSNRFNPLEGSTPGPDRVIFDEDGQYCGIVSHPPSKDNKDTSFVLCTGGK